MVFDNNLFFSFLYKLRDAGVNCPVLPGIMPITNANQVEKAKKVFTSLADAFPEGQKVCTTMFKLAAIYSAEGNIDMQKQYLQKILNSKTCSTSGEFEQAAEILQEILEQETQAGPKTADPSSGPEASAPAPEAQPAQ